MDAKPFGASVHVPVKSIQAMLNMAALDIAQRLNLVNRLRRLGGCGQTNKVFPAETFEEEVSKTALRLAQGPTATYGRVRNLMRLGLIESLESQMENERQGIITSALSEEFREGITAFAGKRKPDFASVG
mgnify:CR=1 FL=1